MGALLVTLLQCRHNQSLYPNVGATQARQVTYQQPCSVPLIAPQTHRSRSLPSASSSLAEADTTVDREGAHNNHVNHKNVHEHCRQGTEARDHFRLSLGSSELGGGPIIYKPAAPVSEVPKTHARKRVANTAASNEQLPHEQKGGVNEEGGRCNDAARKNGEGEEALACGQAFDQHERLRFGLTCQAHTSADSDESKTVLNVIYRYTLPGALSASSASPPQPLLLATQPTSTTPAKSVVMAGTTNVDRSPRAATATADAFVSLPLPLPPACSTPLPPSFSNDQKAQPGGSAAANLYLNVTQSEPSQQQQQQQQRQQSSASAKGATITNAGGTMHLSTSGCGGGGDSSTPLSLTPIRTLYTNCVAASNSSSNNNSTSCPTDFTSTSAPYGLVSSNDRDAARHTKTGRIQSYEGESQHKKTKVSNVHSNAVDDAELGPMDCADAFQYFYDDGEEAYGDVESVVYIAPSKALLATSPSALRDYYHNQQAALRGCVSGSGASGETDRVSLVWMGAFGICQDIRGDQLASQQSQQPCPAAASDPLLPRAAPQKNASSIVVKPAPPPPPGLKNASTIYPSRNTSMMKHNYINSVRSANSFNVHPLNDALNFDIALARSFLDAAPANSTISDAAATVGATFASNSNYGKPPHDAGRFVSLVEEMRTACRRIGNAPFVCWRSVDRIAPLQEESRRFFSVGSITMQSSSGALQNARGEVEDDVSHLPGSATKSARADKPRTRTAAEFFKNYYSNSGNNNHGNIQRCRTTGEIQRVHGGSRPAAAATSPSLYYLGPQQYVTASVWWSRVEAFSLGLHSIGLRPGDFFGIVEDTRWEWLVTCYAAWNTGLVVVVFDASERTVRRVALDTQGQMKAVMCNPQVHRAVRRRFKEAAAQAALYAAEKRSTGHQHNHTKRNTRNQNNNKSSANLTDNESRSSGENTQMDDVCMSDSTGRGGTSTSVSTTATTLQQQQHNALPLFIIVRSVAPARDSEEEQHLQKSTTSQRGTSVHREGEAAASSSGRLRRVLSGCRLGCADDAQCNSNRTADSDGDGSASSADEEDDEDEEALWWSDILSHGETKLAAWRQRKARERRQCQQKQARLRFQQLQQQQRQRWARSDFTENNTTFQGNEAAQGGLRRRKCSTSANPPIQLRASLGGAVGSCDGSAVSASTTAPKSGWAAAATCTTTVSNVAMTISTPATTSASAGVALPSTTHTLTSVTATASPQRTMPAPSANTVPVITTGEGQMSTSVDFVHASCIAARTPTQQRMHMPYHVTSSLHLNTGSVTPPPPSSVGNTSSPSEQQLKIHTDNTNNNYSRGDSTQPPLAPLRPDDLAFIIYTEGDPKGVLLTHGAVKASMAAHQEYLDTTDIDVDDGLRRGSNQNASNLTSAVSGAGGVKATGGGNVCNKTDTSTNRTTTISGVDGAHREGRLARYCASAARMPALRSRTAPVGRPSYLAYLPLHYISEFMAQTSCLIRGVLVCYGTRRTLFDTFARPHGDLTEYKPTVFPALPATLARLHRAVQAMLSNGYRKLLFEVAYEARRQAIRRGLQSPFVLSTIFAQPRELLGGRCRLVLVREAPLHPRDAEYLEVVCGVSVVQQFGPVETAGCALQQAYCSGHLDTIGGPFGPTQVKLRDVAGGWTHRGERPTGELLVAGPTVMVGYYCQPERTAEVLEKNGWWHSGTVAERCPDGSFRLIASLRPHYAINSNGQCFDLEYLEAIYARHPLCTPNGVCLLVHPYRRYICALILSTEKRVRVFLDAEAAAASAATASIGCNSSNNGERSSTTSSPLSPFGASLTSPLAALASAAAMPGWWPQCLRDPALNTAAALSLATWAADCNMSPCTTGTSSGGNGVDSGEQHHRCYHSSQRVGVAPHERVRRVRVLYDVWDVTRHTRTPTGRLFRCGIHCRYSAIIQELFAEPD